MRFPAIVLLAAAAAAAQPLPPDSLAAAGSYLAAETAFGLPSDMAPPSPDVALEGLPPDDVVPARLAVMAGTLAAGSAALYIYQKNAWWAEEHRTSFHLHYGDSSKSMDKAGHFLGTAVQSHVIARAARWSGLSPNESALAGATAAWLLQLHVEVEDGLNALWGFDPYDVVANTLGAGVFYAQERVPALAPFALKFSYWPTQGVTNQPPEFEGRPPSPIDDYDGHTYWLGLRVHDLLPVSAARYWPPWLCLAGGVSGHALDTDEATREYFLSLDVDLTRVLPARTWLGTQLREMTNYLHLPAPALRLRPRLTPYLLYYSQD